MILGSWVVLLVDESFFFGQWNVEDSGSVQEHHDVLTVLSVDIRGGHDLSVGSYFQCPSNLSNVNKESSYNDIPSPMSISDTVP